MPIDGAGSRYSAGIIFVPGNRRTGNRAVQSRKMYEIMHKAFMHLTVHAVHKIKKKSMSCCLQWSAKRWAIDGNDKIAALSGGLTTQYLLRKAISLNWWLRWCR